MTSEFILLRLALVLLFFTFISWKLLYWLIPRLSHHLSDVPNERSSHKLPTPRGGGIVFVLIGTIFSPYNGWNSLVVALFICLPLGLLGLIDDLRDQPIKLRFSVQFMTALGIAVITSDNSSYWQVPFKILFIIALVNFTNFMDGLDGLVATCTILILAFPLLRVVLYDQSRLYESNLISLLPLMGGLFGFLLLNWSPAKIFMGDIGSTFIGAVISAIILQQDNWFERLGLLLIGFPLLGDAFFCVVRRLFTGQHIFKPHRLHLFQRLHQAGWSHQEVTIAYSTATLVLGIGWLIGGTSTSIAISIGILILGILIDRTIAVPFTSLDK